MGSATSTASVESGAIPTKHLDSKGKPVERGPGGPGLATTTKTAPAADQGTSTPNSHQHVIVGNEFRPLELESIKDVNYNVKLFRFKFPDAHAQLQRSIACFYFVRADIDGESVQRPYTPVSPVDAQGYLTLMVKVYEKPYGKMGNHLCSLKPGDTLDFKGPLSKVDYSANK